MLCRRLTASLTTLTARLTRPAVGARFVTSASRDSSQDPHTDADSTHRSEDAKTHFGFETVGENEKSERVYKVFENVADKYDLMNDAMSCGIHRLWKDIFMERLGPTPGTSLLDVAGGTADISLRFLQYLDNLEGDISDPTMDVENASERSLKSLVTVSDINQAMLDVGKEKLDKLGYKDSVSYLCADAENLPIEDNSYDVYTIAFGIRNCTHIDKVLDEAYRVLKPGGRFMCLEFSQVENPLLSTVYDLYSFQAIPVMGQVLASDYRSYQYLVESIRKFPDQVEFRNMIEDAGFRMVTYENLSFGVAAIHSGFKV